MSKLYIIATFYRCPNSPTIHHPLCATTVCLTCLLPSVHNMGCPAKDSREWLDQTYTWNTSQLDITMFNKGKPLILSRHFSSIETAHQKFLVVWERKGRENNAVKTLPDGQTFCTVPFFHLIRPKYICNLKFITRGKVFVLENEGLRKKNTTKNQNCQPEIAQ